MADRSIRQLDYLVPLLRLAGIPVTWIWDESPNPLDGEIVTECPRHAQSRPLCGIIERHLDGQQVVVACCAQRCASAAVLDAIRAGDRGDAGPPPVA